MGCCVGSTASSDGGKDGIQTNNADASTDATTSPMTSAHAEPVKKSNSETTPPESPADDITKVNGSSGPPSLGPILVPNSTIASTDEDGATKGDGSATPVMGTEGSVTNATESTAVDAIELPVETSTVTEQSQSIAETVPIPTNGQAPEPESAPGPEPTMAAEPMLETDSTLEPETVLVTETPSVPEPLTEVEEGTESQLTPEAETTLRKEPTPIVEDVTTNPVATSIEPTTAGVTETQGDEEGAECVRDSEMSVSSQKAGGAGGSKKKRKSKRKSKK